MKSIVRWAVAGGISILSPGTVFAQFSSIPLESCDDYASRAVSQVQMAAGCQVTGPRWSPNAAEHKNWCARAPQRDRDREYDERMKSLVACRGDSGVAPIANCHDYSFRFRSQLDLANLLPSSCGFEGMRWSEIQIQHFHWCNRTDASRHATEDAARRKELAECKGPQ